MLTKGTQSLKNRNFTLAKSGVVKRRFRNQITLIKKHKESYLLLAPFFVLFTVFFIAPVVISMFLSFTYYNILEPPKIVGWQNYIKLFLADDIFLIAVKNTFLFAAITGPASYIACFLFAWFVNELSPKIRSVVTLLLTAPSLSGNAYMIWTVMFSGDTYGYVNSLLIRIGMILEPIQWLQNPKYMMVVIILVTLWMNLGISFLAFIAGLQGIDRNLYEAAAIDGIKNRWQELWFITLPSMKPILMFGAVMQITSTFNVGSVCTALAGFPSVDYAAHTVVTHLMDYGTIRFEMGYASAIATVLFLVMVGSNKWVQNLLKKVGE